MKVINIHERTLAASPTDVGALIDSLASSDDRLWPHRSWPPMRFDGPLAVGATGGHGPIRYAVESYEPGRRVRFRFRGPKGFDGVHGFEMTVSEGGVRLRHVVDMRTHGPAILTWPLLFGPLHDALLEDALSCAEAALRLEPTIRPWSPWVRFLRWVFARGGKEDDLRMP